VLRLQTRVKVTHAVKVTNACYGNKRVLRL